MKNVSASGANPKKGIVYLATNLVNGKVYVGITTRALHLRINEHRYDSDNDKAHSPTYFHNALAKYGLDQFQFDVLEEIEYTTLEEMREVLYTLEKKYISQYRSNDKRFGYNLTLGGDGITGYHMSLEQRQKISAIHKGKHLSEEHKARIRAFMSSDKNPNIGRKLSEETKAKLSALFMGRYAGARNPMYGKKRPDLSERNKKGSKRVCQCDLATGEVIKVWDSFHEIARATGYNRSCIKDCCNHRTKQSHGYKWEFYSQQ